MGALTIGLIGIGCYAFRLALRYRRDNKVADEFCRAADRLEEWLDAHPVLHTVHIEHQRKLVLDVLRPYERALELKLIEDDGFLNKLRRLLEEKPPPQDPDLIPGLVCCAPAGIDGVA